MLDLTLEERSEGDGKKGRGGASGSALWCVKKTVGRGLVEDKEIQVRRKSNFTFGTLTSRLANSFVGGDRNGARITKLDT
jgi:hypothetical protein